MRRSLLLSALVAGSISGCGPKLSPVNGTVTLDGSPIGGASIVFMDESGSKSASGRSDASGNFSLEYDNKPGIPPGTYKVLVTLRQVGEPMSPPPPDGKVSKDYLAGMKAKDIPKTGGGPQGLMPTPVGKSGSAKVDVGELPAIYSSPSTTPFTIQVPVSGPVELKLEKKK